MCAMSARIRATPDWWTKLNDTTTLDRWRANELAGGSEPAAVDYVLAELERYVKLRDASSGIEVCILFAIRPALVLMIKYSHPGCLL